jgi:hypothetical protein
MMRSHSPVRAVEPEPGAHGQASLRSGLDERRRGWFWHWNSIVTQYAPLIGLKGIGLLNSYTVWTDRRSDSPLHGYAFPSQEAEAAFYGEDRQELITINKILVTLGLIEIRKEMVVRIDARGRRWRVPHNLYRVRDSSDGYTLTTDAVRAVLELAERDAEVFRYIRHIFAPRFAPIDRQNPWHDILTELQPTPLWQRLARRAAATAESYRRRAARARGTAPAQEPVAPPSSVAGSDTAWPEPVSGSSVTDSNIAVSTVAEPHSAPSSTVASSDRTYHQSESRTTFESRSNDSGQSFSATGNIERDSGLPLPLESDSPIPESPQFAQREYRNQRGETAPQGSTAALEPLLAMLCASSGERVRENGPALPATLIAELTPAVRSQTPELTPEDWLLAAVIEAVDQMGADATLDDVAAICRRWMRAGFRTPAPDSVPDTAAAMAAKPDLAAAQAAGDGQVAHHAGTPTLEPVAPTGLEPLLDDGRFWQAVLQEVCRHVSLPVYRTWFHDAVLLRREPQRVVVQAPTRLAADWLRTRGVRVLEQALTHIAGTSLEIQVVTP